MWSPKTTALFNSIFTIIFGLSVILSMRYFLKQKNKKCMIFHKERAKENDKIKSRVIAT